MLYLINLELGGYKDNTQFVVYDDYLNEINAYTEKQIVSKINKGIEIQGVVSNGVNCLVSYCKIQVIPGVITNERLLNNSSYLSNIKGITNLVILHKPIKLNKIKSGMVFVYKNVKLLYVVNRPVEQSCWYMSYYTGILNNNTLKDNNINVDLNTFFKSILEMSSYLNYKLKITIELDRLNVKLNYLDLSCLSVLCKNHYLSYSLRSINNVNYINVGNIDLNKTNLMGLTGYLKSDKVTIWDFSECCIDYYDTVPTGCSSSYDFCLPSSVEDSEKVIFIFNQCTPRFIEKYTTYTKLTYLGIIPTTIPKNQIPAFIEQLRAKRVLVKNLDTKRDKYYVIMK